MLYIPVIGDIEFPDTTKRFTGCAILKVSTLPGITTVNLFENCEAKAFMSFIILAVWNVLAKEDDQEFTTVPEFTMVLPEPSTANPKSLKLRSVIL